MSIAARLRARRAAIRGRRRVARAFDSATSPAVRHELMAISQWQLGNLR